MSVRHVLKSILESGIDVKDHTISWGTNERIPEQDLAEVTSIAFSKNYSETERRLAIIARYWITRSIKGE